MQIEEYRRNILEKIGGWLKLLQQIKETMDALSMDTGLLFDMSQGVPSVQDIEEIKKWVEYIRQNQSIKELCEMLGKMRSIEESERADRVEAVVEYENMVKNTSSKEEYIGLKLGNDIENIVKSELALLDGSELELLFDKKFVERQLLCFDMAGFTNMVESKVENKEQNVLEKDKCGPIIVCVDTSGSMSGMPETIAKAITLYMAFHARKQDRACYLVNFSTQIEEMDFSKNMNCEQFVTFLRKSFHGGTDATPALRAAIQKVQSNQYEKADILMISDFIMPELGSEMLESMDATRTTGNRFYALSICRDDISGMSTGAFDDIYVYDSFSGGLSSMMSFTRNVTQRR